MKSIPTKKEVPMNSMGLPVVQDQAVKSEKNQSDRNLWWSGHSVRDGRKQNFVVLASWHFFEW